MNIHQISRGRAKTCKERVSQLVQMILGDESYLKSNWDRRTELVTEVMNKLNDPEFVLDWLMSLQRSNNTPLSQEDADVIHESDTPYQDGVLQIEAETLQKTKEESQSINEELNQINEILEQKDQFIKNVNVYVSIAKMLNKVVNSCSAMAAHDILNIDSPSRVLECHDVCSVPFKREKGQITLTFHPTPVHNQEVTISSSRTQMMISEEKQSREVTLTIRSVAGSLAEIKLANPEMLDHEVFDSGTLDDNYKCNADVLNEIFDKHSDVAEKFKIANPELKIAFFSSLAGLYQKIKSEQERLEQKESMIRDMELSDLGSIIGDMELDGLQSMIQDMELNGLQLSWLQTMLTDVRERKTLLEVIMSNRAKAQKAEQQLAELRKKRRFE